VQKTNITAELVEELVASQFPQWHGLHVTPVEVDGWDNTTFRLGSSMSVRLPSADAYVAQLEKEHQWLPVLATQLPVPIPVPLGRGEPSPAFPRPWSVYRWIEGDLLTVDRLADIHGRRGIGRRRLGSVRLAGDPAWDASSDVPNAGSPAMVPTRGQDAASGGQA
jgi:aminoglycoside phosphotransferase (APT) family kinase protein